MYSENMEIEPCSSTATETTNGTPGVLSHSGSTMSLRRWEIENEVQPLSVSANDELIRVSAEKQANLLARKPWSSDVNYFKQVRISALAALKMVVHANEGGNIEVMGMLLGKVDFNSFIILDAVPLPVEGTETRVNAQSQAYEFMSQHMQYISDLNRAEKMVGWYHSHPGYGCWLSGIDVQTQAMHQHFEDPFLAIVIDPIRTISSGKVNLGAFRTYPENYVAGSEDSTQANVEAMSSGRRSANNTISDNGATAGSNVIGNNLDYQVIPPDKVADFGVYSKHYYQLEVSYFKSALDEYLIQVLWNKYWSQTLSSSSILGQSDYLSKQARDLSDKLEIAERGLHRFPYLMTTNKYEELANCSKDARKMGIEQAQSLMGQLFKNILFKNAP